MHTLFAVLILVLLASGCEGGLLGTGEDGGLPNPNATADGGADAGTDGGTNDAGTAACDTFSGGYAWAQPVKLFETEIRLAMGTRLHAVGTNSGVVVHRSSTDEGLTWSAPNTIASAGTMPIYGPLAAEGAKVYLITRASGALRVQRSSNFGATWSAPVTLTGYAADNSDRIQIDAEGDGVHIFAGRAGVTPDPTYKVYYWRSSDSGQSFGGVQILDENPSAAPSPGGIAVENGVVHIGYAALALTGSLRHRARYMRSTDNGVTWSAPVDVSGPGTNPQIRPRPRVLNGRVFVLWEEPLDHNQNLPPPNATRAQIRANVSLDNGVTWQGTRDLTAVSGLYPNHPEVAVGPECALHIVYRLSVNQATLTNDDPMGYRRSSDYGTTWGSQETAIDDPTQETHPVNLVSSPDYVHVASPNGMYARRRLR